MNIKILKEVIIDTIALFIAGLFIFNVGYALLNNQTCSKVFLIIIVTITVGWALSHLEVE